MTRRDALGYVLVVVVAVFVAWLLSVWAPGVFAAAFAVPRSMPFECANCGRDLEVGKRKRRRIPRLGGKHSVVCVACAREIDQQGTLPLDPGRAA